MSPDHSDSPARGRHEWRRAEATCGLETNLRRPNDTNPARAGEQGKRTGAETDRAAALYQDAIPQSDLRQFNRMGGGRQATAAADPLVRRDARRQR